MEICIPHSVVKVNRNLPWVNKCSQSDQEENTLFHIAKRTGKPTDHAEYKAKHNQVVKMLRESKQTFFNQRLNNAKTFWKAIRLLNCDYSSIPTLLDGDGSNTVESSSAKAMCRNNFFYTCFNHNYPPLTDAAQDLDFTYGSLCPSHCPAQLLCTEESVLALLAGLDISKSTGRNGISPKMLKSTSLSMHCSIIMQVVQPLNIYWHFSYFMETGENYPNSQRHKQVPSLLLQTNICSPPSCKQTH